MYLKSIEIQGFKSFANKTVLQFHEGVTGIVGPNGSGKSNVADAVRWVLGEQKIKQLRGASMQDVIFAGTEIRKPQGFAFVAITLDNADQKLPVEYTEVTVSRRLYRSGESEYMINGQAVRLKDIQELFYDTGIGKEGYSIIGQGQIDAILSGKPEERRGLFDEAAGIVKFKRRKQIAERKLESERQNLVRISDILTELSRQVGPLKKQSENARAYLKLRDELKRYDLNLFIRETEELLIALETAEKNEAIVKASLADTKEEQETLSASHSVLSESLRQSEALLNEKKELQKQGELSLQNLKAQIQLAETEIGAKESSIGLQNERLSRLSSELEEKKDTVFRYLSSLSALKEQLSLLHEKKQEEAKALGLEERFAEDAGSEAELLSLEEKIAGFRRQLCRLMGLQEEALSEALRLHEKEAQEASERAALGDAKKEALSEEAEEENEDEEDRFVMPDWLSQIKHKQNDLSAIKEREERVKGWLNHATEEYNKETQRLKDLNRKINDCQQEYHVAKTRLDALKNLAERYEGYGQSIRSVMALKDRIRGIHGVVADLMRTEKQYETAVETALGGSIQNIVTDSEETAKTLIEHLKKNRLGRATFLPLDAIRGKEQKEYREAAKEPGAVGLASDIVETAERYRSLCEHLLGRSLVVDTMDNAIRIARKYKHSLRIVTLAGELLSPGGAISGGAYKNSSNLMGRIREIDELKEKADEILKRVDVLNGKIVSAERSVAEQTEEIDTLTEELKEISIEKNSLSLGIMSEMKLKYSGLSQKTEFIAENIRRLSNELLSAQEEEEQLLSQRTESTEFIAKRRRDIAARREDIAHIEQGLSETLCVIEAETEKQRELSASQQSFFQRREELSSEILELEKELMRLENKREKEQQKLDSQTDYIWTEYELSLTAAKCFYEEELGSVPELKSHISELKGSIRALGPVNLEAIEDYKEVSERYEFLSEQHKDLVESEASILAIIEELDAGMKKQFAEKFRLIQAEFDKVFKTLFGGGHGSLELVSDEETDVLDAGIVINAQPPGKKLQNMMQLSGGEKALTAIALLFAIQNLKPSPFCLLDEIEAALDDSNVGRFANYLHKLTEHTQFIVITHRRGTMEAADRLYGITMQEKGVTALVSVDLVSESLS